jgi:hypothetical protein
MNEMNSLTSTEFNHFLKLFVLLYTSASFTYTSAGTIGLAPFFLPVPLSKFVGICCSEAKLITSFPEWQGRLKLFFLIRAPE